MAQTRVVKEGVTAGLHCSSVVDQKDVVSKVEFATNVEQNVANAIGAEALHAKLSFLLKQDPNLKAFDLFVQQKQAGQADISDYRKKNIQNLSEEWRALSTDQKNKYVLDAQFLRDQFAKQRAKLSTEEATALNELIIEKTVKTLGNKQRQELYENIETAEAKFNALSDGEKQEFIGKFDAAFTRYLKHLSEWEEKMIVAEHKDIVGKFPGAKLRRTLNKKAHEVRIQAETLQRKADAMAERRARHVNKADSLECSLYSEAEDSEAAAAI